MRGRIVCGSAEVLSNVLDQKTRRKNFYVVPVPKGLFGGGQPLNIFA